LSAGNALPFPRVRHTSPLRPRNDKVVGMRPAELPSPRGVGPPGKGGGPAIFPPSGSLLSGGAAGFRKREREHLPGLGALNPLFPIFGDAVPGTCFPRRHRETGDLPKRRQRGFPGTSSARLRAGARGSKSARLRAGARGVGGFPPTQQVTGRTPKVSSEHRSGEL